MEVLVTSRQQLETLIDRAYHEKWIALDTEACGPTMPWISDKKKASMIDEYRSKMVGWSFAFGDEYYYVPVAHQNGENIDAPELLRRLLAHPGRVWLHNAKFDMRIIANYLGEYVWPTKLSDTMVLAYLTGDGVPVLIDGEMRYKHGLKDITLHHFKHKMATFAETVGAQVCTTPGIQTMIANLTEELALCHQDMGQQLDMFGLTVTSSGLNKEIKKYTKEINKLKKMLEYRERQADECTPLELASYAAEDAKWTLALAKKFGPKLIEMGYVRQFDEVEMPCIKIIRSMQDDGVRIDVPFFEQMQAVVGEEARKLADRWRILTNSEITSARQSAKAVYEDMRAWEITDASKTQKGQLSVNKKAIAFVKATTANGSLAGQLADIKLEHSKKYKIANTYTHAIIRQIPYRTDGRLHGEINMVGTETGRFSCNSPNLQAMPREMVRKGFLASDGCLLVDGDWSNLEVVIMAHYTHDPNFLAVILGGKNMHTLNAEILGCERNVAKTVFFAWQYGARPKKIATALNIPLIERNIQGRIVQDAPDSVHELYERLNKAYSSVVEWRQEIADQCRVDGYVTTLTGHRRYLPQIKDQDRWIRLRAERAAANAVIQGTAAGIAKAAMVRLSKSLAQYNKSKLLLQIHDELLCEVDAETSPVFSAHLKDVMETTTKLSIPLKAEVGIGKSWDEAK